jgi:hypothetical protein
MLAAVSRKMAQYVLLDSALRKIYTRYLKLGRQIPQED